MNGEPRLSDFYRLLSHRVLDSTNEEARRQAEKGAPEGTLIWAREQSAGRGRRGRSWTSVPGNLYMSILLRPQRQAGEAAQLGFAAALAIGEAVTPHLHGKAALAYKWPNDVLIDGCKTSGILLESQAAGEGRLDWLVVGMGINLVSFPPATEYPATSLAAFGAFPSVEAMLVAVAERFRFWYERWRAEGFSPLRVAWLARARGVGDTIRVRLHGEETSGVFAGLDDDGALLLDTGTGRRRVAAGDVFPAGR